MSFQEIHGGRHSDRCNGGNKRMPTLCTGVVAERDGGLAGAHNCCSQKLPYYE